MSHVTYLPDFLPSYKLTVEHSILDDLVINPYTSQRSRTSHHEGALSESRQRRD